MQPALANLSRRQRRSVEAADADKRRANLHRHRLSLVTGVVLSALVLALARIPTLMGWPTAQGHTYLLAVLALPAWLGVDWNVQSTGVLSSLCLRAASGSSPLLYRPRSVAVAAA